MWKQVKLFVDKRNIPSCLAGGQVRSISPTPYISANYRPLFLSLFFSKPCFYFKENSFLFRRAISTSTDQSINMLSYFPNKLCILLSNAVRNNHSYSISAKENLSIQNNQLTVWWNKSLHKPKLPSIIRRQFIIFLKIRYMTIYRILFIF